MNVIQLPRQRHRTHPIICFVDLQVEYVSAGRALGLRELEPWLDNCRRLLGFAREQRLPIAHFRQLRGGALLNPATGFAGWIEEFRPRPSEMVFERELPSCYAAAEFKAVMARGGEPTLIICGLTSGGACLATVLEAFHRGHSTCFVSDASWSQQLGGVSEREANETLAAVIGQYTEVLNTDEVLEWLSKQTFSLVS